MDSSSESNCGKEGGVDGAHQVTGGFGRVLGVGGSKHLEAAKLLPCWGDPWWG